MFSDKGSLGIENSSSRRLALIAQYDGTTFCGWQRQEKTLAVQEVLEDAIAQLDPYRPIKTIAAGRTDAGVHAAGQVVHFDVCGPIPAKRWASALNGRLPKSIRVLEVVDRPKDWHACYSAKFRRYRYTIFNSRSPNVFLAPWSWHRYQFRLDEELMLEGLKGLLGNHDFTAFQRSGSNRAHSRTTIEEVTLDRKGDLLFIEIQATGFLYGMVRLIVGQLVLLGEHKLSKVDFETRWKLKQREEVKEAAPPHGLCFLRTGYEDKIFSESFSYGSAPLFLLPTSDQPTASRRLSP